MVYIAFPSLDGMQKPVSCPAPASTKVLASHKALDFLRPSETQLNGNNPGNQDITRNTNINIKQKKWPSVLTYFIGRDKL